jgi:glycine oxidase
MAVALAEGAKRKGAEIRPNTPVTGFLRVPGRVNGVKTPRGDIYAGTTILAAGAWSSELLQPLGLDLKVKPIKGQILLAGGPPDFCRHMILDGESYLIPRADGRILVGSTLEDVGFDKSVILETIGDLALRGARLMPELGKLPMVTSWAGLRPATPDRLPYLGKGPLDGLIVATGHYRNGILLAPITAEIVADLLAGQPSSVDLAPFDPLRVPQAIESAG